MGLGRSKRTAGLSVRPNASKASKGLYSTAGLEPRRTMKPLDVLATLQIKTLSARSRPHCRESLLRDKQAAAGIVSPVLAGWM